MDIKNTISINVAIDDEVLLDSLQRFLNDMHRRGESEPLDHNERRLLQDARTHAADAEKEADKLRDALAVLADVTQKASERMITPLEVSNDLDAACRAAAAAITAYDNCILKIPF